jgi:hypothetical protein
MMFFCLVPAVSTLLLLTFLMLFAACMESLMLLVSLLLLAPMLY